MDPPTGGNGEGQDANNQLHGTSRINLARRIADLLQNSTATTDASVGATMGGTGLAAAAVPHYANQLASMNQRGVSQARGLGASQLPALQAMGSYGAPSSLYSTPQYPPFQPNMLSSAPHQQQSGDSSFTALFNLLNSQNQGTFPQDPTSLLLGLGSFPNGNMGSVSNSIAQPPSLQVNNQYLDFLTQQLLLREAGMLHSGVAAAPNPNLYSGAPSQPNDLSQLLRTLTQGNAMSTASAVPALSLLNHGGAGTGLSHNYPLPPYPTEALRLLLDQQRNTTATAVQPMNLYAPQQSESQRSWSEGKEEAKSPPPTHRFTNALALTSHPTSASTHESEMPWSQLMVSDSPLSLPELRGLVSDLHLAALAQMQPCVLTREDRVGPHKTRNIGFPGLSCKYCGGVPGFGRFFPSTLANLVNGNICKSITKHLQEECRVCPSNVKASLASLERDEENYPYHYQRGARSEFFSKIWHGIQDYAATTSGSITTDGATTVPSAVASARRDSDRAAVSELVAAGMHNSSSAMGLLDDDVEGDSNVPWASILKDSDIVLLEDRHLVPDSIFAATAQTKPCQLTDADRVGRCKEHKFCSMGLCCKHCEGKPGSYGRYFPSNLHTFAQVEVSKQIVKHITRKCPSVPDDIRDAIMDMQQQEENVSHKRFPSRMVFFRRVWYRFHYGESTLSGDVNAEGGDTDGTQNASSGEGLLTAEEIPWTELVADSHLVTSADRGLISDSQFATLAQMDRTTLVPADRVGYCKNHTVGFVGLSCRFCQGRPGFGRYFATTVRNLEKTSARDTMVSHISLFCQKCPDTVRNAVLSLKRIESSHDGSATMQSLTYGSGKLFFRRIWSRLHQTGEGVDDGEPRILKKRKPKAAGVVATAPMAAARPSPKEESSDYDSAEHAIEGSACQHVDESEKEDDRKPPALSDTKLPAKRPRF